MANILVFEDSNERLKFFGYALINHSVQFARNVEEAVKLFKNNKFDIAFFDHDIDESEFTGYTLVKWLVDNNLYLPIVYHTFNYPGYQNMNSLIPGKHVSCCWLLDNDSMNKLISRTVCLTSTDGGSYGHREEGRL